MFGNMGVRPDIIEAALNHATIHSPLAATYNLSRYLPQVREALQRLADVLDDIEQGRGSGPGRSDRPTSQLTTLSTM